MIRPLALIALAALASSASAQGLSSLKGHDSNAPIDISSDRLEVQDRADRAIWVGNVHVVQGNMTMDAARMTASFSQAKTPGGNLEIHRIDASGGVTVVSPSERAKGDFGIYDIDRRLITLIGNVSLVRGANAVKGARLVIDMNSGRATVDGSSVGGASTSQSGGRVTGHFTVPKRTTASPAPRSAPPK